MCSYYGRARFAKIRDWVLEMHPSLQDEINEDYEDLPDDHKYYSERFDEAMKNIKDIKDIEGMFTDLEFEDDYEGYYARFHLLPSHIAIALLEDEINTATTCWEDLSFNDDITYFVEKNIKLILDPENYYDGCQKSLSRNPNAIHILRRHLHKVCWTGLSSNPNAINILRENIEFIDWHTIFENPNAFDIILNNMDKVDWEYLSMNPYMMDILEQNRDKFDYLMENPGIYTYKYDLIKEEYEWLRQGLTEHFFKPSIVSKWIESNPDKTIEDYKPIHF